MDHRELDKFHEKKREIDKVPHTRIGDHGWEVTKSSLTRKTSDEAKRESVLNSYLL